MSNARAGDGGEMPSDAQQVLELLGKAQAIIDTMDRPDIGARIQEVIEAVRGLAEDGQAA